MKAYLLARVSTDDQKDALPAQVYRLTEYAKKRGYEYEVTEIKESAYKGNRTSFSIVVEKIRSRKELTIVVFDKIDRYTRDSSSEEVRTLQNLYRSGKIELHFPSDNLFIHKDSPATDLLRLGMGIVVAQYYSDAISDNVKRRIEQKLRDGEWIGAAPMGYKNTTLPNGKKWVEIESLPAEAVRDAYNMYSRGASSLKMISEHWKTTYDYKMGVSKVEQVLKNPFYYGDMRVKGQLYPHKYDAIISKELFDTVQNLLNGTKTTPHRWRGLPFTYRGLLSCAICECRITFETKKGKYTYGRCTQSKYKHPSKYINEDDITDQISNIFKTFQIPEEAYQEVSTSLRQVHEDKKRMRSQLMSGVESEIERYQTRIDRIYEDYLDEKIPEDLYKRKSEEYRQKQRNLQFKREKIELVDDDYFATISHLLTVGKDAKKLFIKADIQQKRELLKLVLSNFQLDSEQLRWKLKEPFKTMALCNKNQTWLRRLDSNQ